MTTAPVDVGVTPRCVACGSTYLAWQLQAACLLWRCPRCGHIRRDLALADARSRAPAYGGDLRADRLRLALTYRRIRARIDDARSLDVLEIGCGGGALLARFADAGDRVTGIDPEPAPAVGLEIHQASAEDMPAFTEAFDLVVAIHCLEHVQDLPRVLSNVFRALRPGGTFYALTPNASSEGLRVLGAAWWMLEDPTHRQFLSPLSATMLMEGAGLAAVSTRPVLLDSLGVEGASLARTRGRDRPEGALASRGVRIATMALLPVSLAARAVRPGLSPTLEIVATRAREVSP